MGDLSLVPEILAVRSFVAYGAVTRCIAALVRAAGGAGRELVGELARSPDAFVRKVGAGLAEAGDAKTALEALAATDPVRAGVVERLRADDRPLVRAA